MKRWAVLLVLMATLPLRGHATTPMSVAGGQGAMYTVHLTSLKEARYRSTLHQKYDFSCGSAAVATLLTYQYGYPVNEQVAFEQMYTHGDQADRKSVV